MTNIIHAVIEIWLINGIDMNEDVISSEKKDGHERPHRRGQCLSKFQKMN